MASKLTTLQQEIVDRLLADPFFDDIPVFPEHLEALDNEIDRAEILGLGIVVATIQADVQDPDVPGPYFNEIQLLVRIAEHPITNRNGGTGKTAGEIAEKVCAVLHHWTPDSLSAPLVSAPPSIRVDAPPDDGWTGRACLFHTQGGLSYEVPTLADPGIAVDAGTVTLSHATPGAVLFYTTNGKHPAPRNGTLYTAPFAPGGGLTLKVRAWLPGYLPSAVVTQSL